MKEMLFLLIKYGERYIFTPTGNICKYSVNYLSVLGFKIAAWSYQIAMTTAYEAH